MRSPSQGGGPRWKWRPLARRGQTVPAGPGVRCRWETRIGVRRPLWPASHSSLPVHQLMRTRPAKHDTQFEKKPEAVIAAAVVTDSRQERW